MDLAVNHLLIFICTLLLSGNIYFVKRLVDKIELTNQQTAKDHSSITQLFREVTDVSSQLREIKQDIKDLRRIEIDVAVLKNTKNIDLIT